MSIQVHREQVCSRLLCWQVIWFSLLLLACGLSLFLTCRRIAGALVQPPAGMTLFAAAVGLAGLAALLRIWAPGQMPRDFATVLPGTAVMMVLAAISLPGTSPWGIVAAWLVVIGSEAAIWLRSFSPQPQAQRASGLESPNAVAVGSGLNESEEPEIHEGLVQQFTRIQETADRESIHALVRAEIPANDRQTIVHLSFCPPLAARPELTAHAIDADGVEVKITQAETFGVRLEIREPSVSKVLRQVVIEVIGSATNHVATTCPPDA